jgi:hypothetical protein
MKLACNISTVLLLSSQDEHKLTNNLGLFSSFPRDLGFCHLTPTLALFVA